ncbi:MerR family transcriptional regulator [Actinomadura sp. WAC 06369]|uniref:MerR family transcriptional regulator n=1 Tax=Actinomadura sp. WAC 06369 TaxID=2203193 RepID=UPI000F7A4CA7|nr:MerR family transcriptional regulator [Actinomadura sp. WAC 06369]RSN72075.1 MerR family transcriptional regulator [Actinomadura sp. WAC 06369]
MSSDDAVPIGEAAALYRLAPSTLRWWDRQGVVAPTARHGGRRFYGEDDLRRLGLAYLCRVVGMMPLDAAAVVASGTADLDTWRRTMRAEIDRLDERVERLTAARDYLNHLLRCEDDDIIRCSYLDAELETRTPLGPRARTDLVAAARARDVKTDAVRDEKAGPICPSCGGAVERPARGRPRTYCSPGCRQRAYRARARRDETTSQTRPTARSRPT